MRSAVDDTRAALRQAAADAGEDAILRERLSGGRAL